MRSYQITTLVGPLAAAALLTACASPIPGAEHAEQTNAGHTGAEKTELQQAEPDVIDTLYVGTIRGEVDTSASDESLIELGHSICDARDSGVTDREMARIGMAAGIEAADFGFILGSAQGAYCPEHAGAGS